MNEWKKVKLGDCIKEVNERTTKNNQYIWIVVPNYLTVNRVTSQGFDVTFQAAQSITTSLGTFKAYRTANTLTAQTWKLVIS